MRWTSLARHFKRNCWICGLCPRASGDMDWNWIYESAPCSRDKGWLVLEWTSRKTLLRPKAKWHWGEEHSKVFAELKQVMTSVSVLVLLKAGDPIILNTDIVDFAIGGVLSQAERKRETDIVCEQNSESAQWDYCATRDNLFAVIVAFQALFCGTKVFDVDKPRKLGVALVVQAYFGSVCIPDLAL